MKKVTVTFVLCAYTLLSLGIQLHLHYCCGQFSDFHFLLVEHCDHDANNEQDNCCKKGNCCSFFEIDLSIDDSHQPSEQARYIPIEICQPVVYGAVSQNTLLDPEGCISESHPPPPICKRFVLFGSLVLYA